MNRQIAIEREIKPYRKIFHLNMHTDKDGIKEWEKNEKKAK
jgi:hypothetical protein